MIDKKDEKVIRHADVADGENVADTGPLASGPAEAPVPSQASGPAPAPTEQQAAAEADAAQQAAAEAPVEISCTRGLAEWLVQNQVSLGFTSYQSGRLYLVGADADMRVAFHERFFSRAMGLWSDTQRILISSIFQIWRLENVLAPGEVVNGFDRHYVPRVAHTTGDIDVHEIGVTNDGVIIFVNTLYSCLAVLSETHSFKPLWAPPFISKLAAEDRCHLNGLAMK